MATSTWARCWSRRATSTFLTRYDEAIAAAPQLGLSGEGRAALLDLFLLEKAAYEIQYEAANRPKWLSIPLYGLTRVVERLIGNKEGAAE
jgi:maltose alpha-D-glucosyltransferase/alpha-amylase